MYINQWKHDKDNVYALQQIDSSVSRLLEVDFSHDLFIYMYMQHMDKKNN